jgi:hypothetical protein
MLLRGYVHTCNVRGKGVSMLLKCNGTNKWRKNVLDSKWPYIRVKEEIAYKKTTVSNKNEKFGNFCTK